MRWLRAGRVGRPHGLDGSFHVTHPVPSLLAEGRTLFAGGEEREITRRGGTETRPIIRLARVEDRSAAQGLQGAELLCSRETAPALDEDEWWAADLEGLRVLASGRLVGWVSRLEAFPSCEALSVRRAGGGEALLVPLVKDAVRRVDVKRGEIEIELGFLGSERDLVHARP